MTLARSSTLIAALVVAAALGAPRVAPAGFPPCLRAEIPPAPPPQGAVLAVPINPATDDPNVAVVQAGFVRIDELTFIAAGCGDAVHQPRFIAVDPGGALLFWGENDTQFAWGGISLDFDDPPPVIDDGSSPLFGRVTGLSVEDPVALLQETTRCPGCDLSGRSLTLSAMPAPGIITYVGKLGDLYLADLRGATVAGVGKNYDLQDASIAGATFNDVDFSGASFNRVNVHIAGNGNVLQGAQFINGTDLTDADFTLAFLDHSRFDYSTVDRAIFTGAQLYGTQFTALHFQSPPRFDQTVLGGDPFAAPGAPCTAFANLDLLKVNFASAIWTGSGCVGPLFKDSQAPLSLVDYFLTQPNIASGLDLSNTQVLVSAADRTALAGADLSGAKLAGADFLGEALDLTGAKLDGADLTQVNLSLARLTGASFANVEAAGASFTGAVLLGDGSRGAASFAGAQTDLTGANFVDADISGASFEGADLSQAVFTGARGVGTNFSAVIAKDAVFAGAHLYGDGQAFDGARDMTGVDFTGALLASDPSESGGFDFTDASLTNARFDRAVCVSCNFTNAELSGASFTESYLPGVTLSNATLTRADLDRAWFYCGNLTNTECSALPGSPPQWSWPLRLGSGESYGPVPFAAPDLDGAALVDVTACPDGKAGSVPPAGCDGHWLPDPASAPPIPAPCSASADGACSTPTSTLFDASSIGEPLAIAPAVAPTWNTMLSADGYYVAFDDGTVRRVSDGSSAIVAGQSGTHCAAPREACGDGGPATAALLGTPSGLAVGLDGSLYITDSALLRVRRIDPAGTITTVAGGGGEGCTIPCGDGGPAIDALLGAASGVAVDPLGVLLIAEGLTGVRRVAVDGTISTVAAGAQTGNVRAVTATADGVIYASTSSPDLLIEIDPDSGAVTPVVGTGTSGYNGNTNDFGLLAPGTDVQVNGPQGLAVDLNGNVVFADTGNNLIRAYVPSSGHVIDDIAGVVNEDGTTTGGFNGDDHAATATQLQRPRAVTATRGALRVVADSGNRRIRQIGPAPARRLGEPEPPPPPATPMVTPTVRAQCDDSGCSLSPNPRASAGVPWAAAVALLCVVARRRRP